jgi:hypothetical protein
MNQIAPLPVAATELTPLERLVLRATDALGREPETPEGEIITRERFMEFMVLSLANLFGKTPVAASLLDRSMTKAVCYGMDDGDAGRLSTRGDDWMRLEGLLRVQEGQKSYTLNRPSMAVLCTPTSQGLLGEVLERIMAAYAQPGPSNELRQVTRLLGAYILTRLSRS